jgi:hypothetical protein
MAYEIRAMSLGEVLDTAFRLVRANFVPLVAIGLTVSLPAAGLTYAVEEMKTLPNAATIGGFVSLGFFMLVVSPVVSAAITHAVSEVYQGRAVSFASSLRVGLKLLLPLMGTALLMTLLMGLGMLLLIIPGIYLAFAWMLTYQVLVIERRAGWNALKRTRELSSGHLLRILGVLMVASLLLMVISVVIGLLTASLPLAEMFVSALMQSIFSAYLTAAFVVLYFDIRCRKEAFDLEHLAEQVGLADLASAGAA